MKCDVCGEVIERGEHYILVGNDHVCLACARDYLEEFYQLPDGSLDVEDESVPEDEIDDWISDNMMECHEDTEYWEEERKVHYGEIDI